MLKNSMSKVLGFLLMVGLMLSTLPASAIPITIGEQIVNGGFQNGGGAPSLASWTTGGTVRGRQNASTINTSGGSAGFNSFFASAFAVLGDSTGAIGLTPNSGTSSISQSFTLSDILGGIEIESYDLTIGFYTAFDGRDSVDPSQIHDSFSAALLGITLFSQNSSPFPSTAPSTGAANNQLVNNPYTGTILDLLPGTYTLSFSLNETSGTGNNFTNTAAGIDNVSVTGFANPSPISSIPEPTTMLLLGSGLLGVGLRARKRSKK